MNINKSGVYYATTVASEKPTASTGGLLLVAWASENNSIRMFIPNLDNEVQIFVRNIIGGTDKGWKQAV